MKENYVPGDYVAEDLTWLEGQGEDQKNFLEENQLFELRSFD